MQILSLNLRVFKIVLEVVFRNYRSLLCNIDDVGCGCLMMALVTFVHLKIGLQWREKKKKKKVWLMLTKAKMGHFKLKKSFLTFHFIEFSFHQLQNKQLLLG